MTTVIAIETNCNEWKLRNFHMHYAVMLRWKFSKCDRRRAKGKEKGIKNNIYDGAHVCSMHSKICAWQCKRTCVCASVHRVHLKPLASIIILFIFRLSYYHHHHHYASLFSVSHRFFCSIRHSRLILLFSKILTNFSRVLK